MTRHSKRGPRGPAVFFLILIITGVLTLLGLYHVWTSYQVIGLGYELSNATQEFKRLQEQNRRLKLEFASLKRDVMRQRQATERFHLHPPGPLELFVIPAAPTVAKPSDGPPPTAATQAAPSSDTFSDDEPTW